MAGPNADVLIIQFYPPDRVKIIDVTIQPLWKAIPTWQAL